MGKNLEVWVLARVEFPVNLSSVLFGFLQKKICRFGFFPISNIKLWVGELGVKTQKCYILIFTTDFTNTLVFICIININFPKVDVLYS